jgi:multidrug efflux system membrane fusion protein
VTRRQNIPLSIAALVAALLIAAVIWRGEGKGGDARPPERPLTVDTAVVRVQPMPVSLQAVGQVQSEHTVQIRPQVSGLLKEVYFTEGQAVTPGQQLFLIDPAPYQSALTGARAAWEAAEAQARRLAPLAGQEYVTTQEYDNARAMAGQLKAMLTTAEINLAYTDIRAPLAGRTGSLGAKAGNLVAPTDATPLVVINQMSPILVQYTIPQQLLPELQRYQAQHSIRIFVTRDDGSGDLGEGDLVFVDNAVNAETGTVTLKARLPNSDERLWPGQYVGVRTQLTLQDAAIVVPQTAVQTGQDGNYVYTIEQGQAAVRPVTVDRQVGDLAVVTAGLKEGGTVVTRVPRNLRPGSKVRATEADGQAPAGVAAKAQETPP